MGDLIQFPTPPGPTANHSAVVLTGCWACGLILFDDEQAAGLCEHCEQQHPDRCALYRAFNRSGHLLYVGITTDPDTRAKQHAATKSWWNEVDHLDIEWHPDRDIAFLAERRAIRVEWPRYNLVRYGAGDHTGPWTLKWRPTWDACARARQPWIHVEFRSDHAAVHAALDTVGPGNRWEQADPDGILNLLFAHAARRSSLLEVTYGATGDIAVIEGCARRDADPIADALLDWWQGGTTLFDLLERWDNAT